MVSLRPRYVASVTSTSPRAGIPSGNAHTGAHKYKIALSRYIGRTAVPHRNGSHGTGLMSTRERGDLIMSQPTFLLCVIAAFGAVAFDVFGEYSGHYLQSVDQGVELWVGATVPPAISAILSNTTIILSCMAWIAVTGLAIICSPLAGLRRAAIVTAVYLAPGFGGGSEGGRDVPLVNMLKIFFHRSRPIDSIHHSYSFPSGHTTCSIYMSGALLFILLPGLLEGLRSMDNAPAGTAVDGIGCSDADNAAFEPTISKPAVTSRELRTKGAVTALIAVNQVSLPLWLCGGVLTAIGRVLAQAHWVSDTLAGAFFGAGLLSLACMIDQFCTESLLGLEQKE